MRYFVFAVAALFGMLLWTLPAKSQDCFEVPATIKQLDEFTKAQNVRARAYLYQSQHPAIKVLFVWLSAIPDAVHVSAYRNGCLVQFPDGQTTKMLAIDDEVRHAIGAPETELLFDNGGESPFTTF
jgi:hypothetical protein